MDKRKSSKRSHKFKIQDHPDLGPGEILLSSVSKKSYEYIKWETKRLGEKDDRGRYPVFAQLSEIQGAGFSVI